MDYLDRIGLALDFIEANLDGDLRLEEVAATANSSLYWFHRVFAKIVGESMGEYIRKRRLNRAAEDLVNTHDRIIDIAVKYGFGSHEAFTRSFNQHFRITPSRYRKSGLVALRRSRITAGHLRREHVLGASLMETQAINTHTLGVRIVELPACRMATSKGHDLGAFDQWWSAVDKTRADKFFPRDFMYYDRQAGELVWLYALPAGVNAGVYDVIDFAGGLYAAAISKDEDDIDGERVMIGLKEWVKNTSYFADAESDARPTLFHVVTPNAAFAKMGYRQLDIYLPVK